MDDQQRDSGEGGRRDVRGDASKPDTLADDRAHQKVPPISKDARSRRFLDDRLRSARDYARFGAAAGADIFDGESIERFASVGKIDERYLRMRAQELREDQFREYIATNAPKRIAEAKP